MPRALLVLVAVVVLLLAGIVVLGSRSTEVPLKRVEKPVTLNEAVPG